MKLWRRRQIVRHVVVVVAVDVVACRHVLLEELLLPLLLVVGDLRLGAVQQTRRDRLDLVQSRQPLRSSQPQTFHLQVHRGPAIYPTINPTINPTGCDCGHGWKRHRTQRVLQIGH